MQRANINITMYTLKALLIEATKKENSKRKGVDVCNVKVKGLSN